MSADSSNQYQLFYFHTCPFCIKVRFALWRMGIKIPMRNIKSKPGNQEELVAGGGKKQVPCLRIQSADGSVQWMYESSDIIDYFKSQAA